MSKYIIKNCPAILKVTKVCDDYRTTRDNPQLCKDCTDCVMKQIAIMCNYAIHGAKATGHFNFLGERILKLLDIQEVE